MPVVTLLAWSCAIPVVTGCAHDWRDGRDIVGPSETGDDVESDGPSESAETEPDVGWEGRLDEGGDAVSDSQDDGLAPRCGNGIVEEGEQCDDANAVDGDGCDSDCTRTCQSSADCQDAEECNGAEVCTAEFTCSPAPAPLADGTPCLGAEGLCISGICVLVPIGCDEGFVCACDGSTCGCIVEVPDCSMCPPGTHECRSADADPDHRLFCIAERFACRP